MSADPTCRFDHPNAAQQQFLSLFLRSEPENFRYVAALGPDVMNPKDIVEQTTMALLEKFHPDDPDQPFTLWACRFALNKPHQWIERSQQSLVEGPGGGVDPGQWSAGPTMPADTSIPVPLGLRPPCTGDGQTSPV